MIAQFRDYRMGAIYTFQSNDTFWKWLVERGFAQVLEIEKAAPQVERAVIQAEKKETAVKQPEPVVQESEPEPEKPRRGRPPKNGE